MRTISLLVVVVAACGGGSSTTADQACTDFAQATCTHRKDCSNGTSITRTFGDDTTCLARTKLQCQRGLAAADTGQTSALIESCTAALTSGSYTCVDFFDSNPPTVCAPSGTRANGAACTFNGQCMSAYCSGVKTANCGTCAAPPSAGATCITSTCGHDQECVAMTNMCQPYAAANATCSASLPCASGLGCSIPTGMTTGMCRVTGATVGAACGGTNPGCNATLGLRCSGATGAKMCTMFAIVANGQPCGTLSDGTFAECISGACYTTTGLITGSEMGTCKANAADGAACDLAIGPGCLNPARCITTAGATSGTCTLPDATSCN